MESEQLPPPESQSVPPLPPPRERNAAIGGILLVLVGILFLIGNFFPFDVGQVFLLVVGIAFLLAYFLGRRNVGFLIPGGIISGLGLGVLLQHLFVQILSGGVIMVCLGLGFAFIWIFDRHHVWALITGAILVAIGAYAFATQYYGFQDVGRWWPVVLIVVGIWVLIRRLQVSQRGG